MEEMFEQTQSDRRQITLSTSEGKKQTVTRSIAAKFGIAIQRHITVDGVFSVDRHLVFVEVL